MSFAHNDIDAQIAQMITPQDAEGAAVANAVAPTKVLVVSQSTAIGQAMATEMAQDAEVEGLTAKGSLAHVMANASCDWTKIDFVVFEISDTPQNDLDAIAQLQALTLHEMSFVAVSSKAVEPVVIRAMEEAGVRELLTVKAPDTPPAPLHRQPLEVPAPLAKEAPAAAPPEPEAVAAPDEPQAPPEPAEAVQTPAPVAAPSQDAPVAAQPAEGKITVVLRARGGAGATTLAVNLAVADAAERGAGRTALIDLDIQNAAVSLMLDMSESAEASELVKGTQVPDAAFLKRAMVRHESGVDVLSAPDIFAPLTALSPQTVDTLVASLKAHYDTVIVDMPQGIVEWIEPLFSHAARVLLVSDTSLPSVKRTRRLLDLIAEDHMTLPVEVVINQHRRPLVMSAALKEVENLIARPLKYWIPMDIKAVRRATDLGQPLRTSAKRSAATRAIDQLAQQLFAPAPKR